MNKWCYWGPCLDNNNDICYFLFIVILLNDILRTIEKKIEVPVDLIHFHIK